MICYIILFVLEIAISKFPFSLYSNFMMTQSRHGGNSLSLSPRWLRLCPLAKSDPRFPFCAFFVLQIYSNLGISICLHRIRGNAKPWAKLRYSFLDLVFTDLHSKLKFILVIRVTFFGAHFYCMDYQCETSILIGKRHK